MKSLQWPQTPACWQEQRPSRPRHSRRQTRTHPTGPRRHSKHRQRKARPYLQALQVLLAQTTRQPPRPNYLPRTKTPERLPPRRPRLTPPRTKMRA